jgi:lysozyme family protein
MAGISLTPKLSAEYEKLWASCVIDYKPETAKAVAAKLIKNKARYLSVSRATGVPWYWIAICHQREASGSFLGVLHNGEKILGTGRKTRLVPAGRGPFETWEEAAIDALRLKGLHQIVEWNVGRFWYEVERFNGFGYRYKGVPSPYLWSHTNHYKDHSGDVGDPGGGKYIADHVYDPNHRDTQLGAAAVLKAIISLDPSVALGPTSSHELIANNEQATQAEAHTTLTGLEQPAPSTSAPTGTLPSSGTAPALGVGGATTVGLATHTATTGAVLGGATSGVLLFGLPWYYVLAIVVCLAAIGYVVWRKGLFQFPRKQAAPSSLGKRKSRQEPDTP